MNYYERHLGDFVRDTAHLSMIEEGAYNRLLDRYYATETGIPADQAHRVARARSKEEKLAVDVVLGEFFTLKDGAWVKGRVEEEIAKAQVKIKAAQDNGKRGGRPKKEPVGSENETQKKPTGLPLGSENETQKKAHQTPDTNISTSQPSAVEKFLMRTDWQPSDHVAELARQSGAPLLDSDIPEFMAHWLTKPDTKRTQAEWDKALLQCAKHRKLRAESEPVRSKQSSSGKPTKFDPVAFVNQNSTGGGNERVIDIN